MGIGPTKPQNAVPVTLETKPGLRTTEFWLHLALQVFFFLNTSHVWTYMPPRISGIIQGVMFIGYALARGEAKKGVAFTE